MDKVVSAAVLVVIKGEVNSSIDVAVVISGNTFSTVEFTVEMNCETVASVEVVVADMDRVAFVGDAELMDGDIIASVDVVL